MLGVGFGLNKIASAASLPAIFGGGPPFSLKLDGTDDFMVVRLDGLILIMMTVMTTMKLLLVVLLVVGILFIYNTLVPQVILQHS